jgi:hypothetical protein
MKTVDTLEHHNVHKFTLSGFAFGSLLILISIAYIYKFEDLGFRFLVMYITLVPGIMFILRSLRPPIGFIRGVMTYVGGTLIGAVPLLVTSNNNQLLWLGLAFGVFASALLGAGFTEKPTQAKHIHP